MIVREAGAGSGGTVKKTDINSKPSLAFSGQPMYTPEPFQTNPILDKGAQLSGISKTINNAPTSNTNNVAPTPSGGGSSAAGGGMMSAQPVAAQPMVNSYEAYINAMMAAEREAQLNALEAEYNAAIGELEREKAAIAPTYHEARRQTAGTNAQEMQAMNEMFNAAGLSSGGRAQGAIAQSNVLQRELGALQMAEAQALADVESRRTQIAAQYQGKVREAIMNNEVDKAAMLYEEAIRYDNELVQSAKEKAKTLASIGDYSGYAALGYTAAEIAALTKAAQRSYSGGGGGGSKAPEYTDYYALLDASGTSDYGDAYQKLLGMGLSDTEAKNVAKGYTSPNSTSPTTFSDQPALRNNSAISVYGAWKNGNLGAEDAINILEGYANRGVVDGDEVEYIFSQMGV